jgi:serine protease Do
MRGESWAWRVTACVLAVGAAASCGRGQAGEGGGGGGAGGIPSGATPVATVAVPAPMPTPAPAGSFLTPMQPVSFAPIAKAANPSVVYISTLGAQEEVSPFTHRRRRAQTKGVGTGFVIDKGLVLTNNHVVANAEAIEVKLADERVFSAKVVGTDAATDIAVVRIDAKDVRPLPLGDSDSIEVGDWVVAIGNPFGLSHTVSAGIISAKGRDKNDVPLDPSGFYDFLQTDASINPGNSGGPLLNLKGEVVGVNSAIRGGGAQGIGFAIPINMIQQILPMLERDGRFTRSALGISIRDAHELTKEDRTALDLPEGERIDGAVIEFVAPGGAADKAGLEQGDIIVAFDDKPIDRSTKLQWLASTAGVGKSVTVRIRRGKKTFDQKVTLGQLPQLPSQAPALPADPR